MDTRKLAHEARALVAAGTAKNIADAVGIVVRAYLDQVAGTYTIQAENQWIREVARVERALPNE